MTPTPNESGSILDVIPQLIPILQTLIVISLTYVSKLLKDVRNEISHLSKRIERLDILYTELEKRHAQKGDDLDRRFTEAVHEIKNEQIILRDKIDRVSERATRISSMRGDD